MGVALGYCVVTNLANPDKFCVAVDCDSSFNVTFTELKTVVERWIPVKITLKQLTSVLRLVALTAHARVLVAFVLILQQRLLFPALVIGQEVQHIGEK